MPLLANIYILLSRDDRDVINDYDITLYTQIHVAHFIICLYNTILLTMFDDHDYDYNAAIVIFFTIVLLGDLFEIIYLCYLNDHRKRENVGMMTREQIKLYFRTKYNDVRIIFLLI